MPDKLTPEQRHKCMQSIRGTATKPELKVRRWLWSHGYRYRLNVRSVPGKADIVLRRYRTAIFVNGCFWHGHGLKVENGELKRIEEQDGIMGTHLCCKLPQTNTKFWTSKIIRNKERDLQNYRVLSENGWQVIVIWECQLKPSNIEQTMRGVELLLSRNLLEIYSTAPQ